MNILIVDDDKASRFCTKHLLGKPHIIQEATTQAECLQTLQNTAISLVILDLLMPDVKDFELLKKIKAKYPELKVIILSAQYDIEKAVASIRLGAEDYLVKKTAKNTLINRITQIEKSLKTENKLEGLLFEAKSGKSDIFIPKHPLYQNAYSLALKAAKKNLNLLIRGKTGTGKEILAQYLRNKAFPDTPIISINCGAIPESLAESELFGTEAHAYTGASERKGKFELANGGILFLDEIGNMSLNIQKSLLRALESKHITRVGGNKEIPINFYLISATNTPLEEAIAAGQFREDLYYRINDLSIHLPALNDTPEVIPQFIDYFIQKFNTHYNESYEATAATYAYLNKKTNGNIRSLKKEIQTIVALGHLPTSPENTPNPPNQTFPEQVQAFETNLIKQALSKHNGNITKSAKWLSLKRTTLAEKLKKLNIK